MQQEHTVEKVRTFLEQTLRDELVALYLFPTAGDDYLLPSLVDRRLLIVVTHEADIHALRTSFLPLWQEVESELGQPPLLARDKAFRRHLELHPLLDHHLKHKASRLSGSVLAFSDKPVFPERRKAYMAHYAMRASTVLAADLLAPEEVVAAQRRLHQLTVALGVESESSLSDGERFLKIQTALQKQIDSLQISRTQSETVGQQPADTPYGAGVSAVYEETDRLVIILKRTPFDLLRDLNWARVGQRLQEIGGALHLTTQAQLPLLLRYETPLEVALRRYRHVWGEDPLVSLEASRSELLAQVARTSSQLLVDDTIGSYLTAGDDESLHELIHDYQNRLLNLRLQHELLHRMHNLPAVNPAKLPDSSQPLPVRVDGILEQLDWWTDHYMQALLSEEN